MNRFSALERSKLLGELDNTEYDLLVIGGGITGAGIALDAVSRGLKVGLVEKCDFAWGTSSRSTKLIHGGLRYLKQLEIQLVREVGQERAVAHKNARHLVIPEKMLLPIVEGGSLGKTLSSIALWVYDYLAGVEKDERRKMLNKKQTAAAEPLLRQDILTGGGLYYEYRTDDARLTVSIMKEAVERGATCVNYTEAIDYIYENELVKGVKVKDVLTDKIYTIPAKKVVNATGPWVDKVRQIDNPTIKGKRLQLTKGVHIVVPQERLPVQQAAYFDVMKDGRMVFAIPRGEITYIGTTDTVYNEKIERPRTTKTDVDYILEAANTMFPSVNLKEEDVISSWAGLRPLIHEEGKSASELSRKDEIFYAKSGLISIAGGKLTGYRKMAERIVDIVTKDLKATDRATYKHLKSCSTAKMPVSGGDFKNTKSLNDFIIKRTGEAKQIGASQAQIASLVYKYGTNTDLIIEKAFELYPTIEDENWRLQVAELWYTIHHEMTVTLNDYLIRRTGRLYFERASLGDLYTNIAMEMAKYLDWDEVRTANEISKFKREYEEVVDWNAKQACEA